MFVCRMIVGSMGFQNKNISIAYKFIAIHFKLFIYFPLHELEMQLCSVYEFDLSPNLDIKTLLFGLNRFLIILLLCLG